MKAALVRRYGPPDTVRIEEVPRPVPKEGEVLVRIQATTVTSADHRIRACDVPKGLGLVVRLAFGWSGPRQPILGAEAVGVVVATGAGVSQWSPGDEVVLFSGARMGLHAEFATFPQTGALARRPSNLSRPEAAALAFGGTTALFFLRDRANVQAGERVLVTGAAGAVGSAACQIAKAFGAQVTAMCSADKAASLAALGITDHIASGATPGAGQQWDVIIDTAGIMSMARARDWLAPDGRLCQILADLPQMIAGAVVRLGEGRKVLGGVSPERAEDLRTLVDMAEAGLLRPLVGTVLPFDKIAEAHALAASKHKLGSTVLLVSD